MQKSTRQFPPFLGSLLAITHRCGLPIPAKISGRVSVESSNYLIGIVLLEQQISDRSAAPPPATASNKRARGMSAARSAPALAEWTELAALYMAIGEQDLFQEVTEKHISRHPATSEGISAELQSDFKRAYEVYSLAIQNAADAEERDLDVWEERAVQCAEKLMWWEEVSRFTHMMIGTDPLSVLWEPSMADALRYFVLSYSRLWRGYEKAQAGGATAFKEWTAEDPNPLVKFVQDAGHIAKRCVFFLYSFANTIP